MKLTQQQADELFQHFIDFADAKGGLYVSNLDPVPDIEDCLQSLVIDENCVESMLIECKKCETVIHISQTPHNCPERRKF